MTRLHPWLMKTTVVAVLAVTAGTALGACARPERAAEAAAPSAVGAVAAPVTPDEAASAQAPVAGDPIDGLRGGLRGVDVCIFNRRSEPFTVEFNPDAQVQGSPTVAPGAWFCGYLRDSALSIVLDGQIFLDGNTLYFMAQNDLFFAPSLSLFPSLPGQLRTCDSFKRLDEGESFVTDTGVVRYVSGRNPDDDSWKYLTITVEPSQGASPPDCQT